MSFLIILLISLIFIVALTLIVVTVIRSIKQSKKSSVGDVIKNTEKPIINTKTSMSKSSIDNSNFYNAMLWSSYESDSSSCNCNDGGGSYDSRGSCDCGSSCD